jgi:hypothetical protein
VRHPGFARFPIQIGIHGSSIALGAQRGHRNLVRYHFSTGGGLCQSFRLCRVGIGGDVSPQGDNALVPIQIDGNFLEASLIECIADVTATSSGFTSVSTL